MKSSRKEDRELLEKQFRGVERARYEDLPEPLRGLFPNLIEYKMTPPTCVYFLTLDNEIVYVGRTTDLPLRLSGHRPHRQRGKSFDRVFYLPVCRSDLNAVEEAFIHVLAPPLNITRGQTVDVFVRKALDRYGAGAIYEPEDPSPAWIKLGLSSDSTSIISEPCETP